jgi:hypothetical protein
MIGADENFMNVSEKMMPPDENMFEADENVWSQWECLKPIQNNLNYVHINMIFVNEIIEKARWDHYGSQ